MSLSKELMNKDVPPCHGCPHFVACAGGMACERFLGYTDCEASNKTGKLAKWRLAFGEQEPRQDIYQRLYGT